MTLKPRTQRSTVQDRDHDTYISTIKFLNVKLLDQPADLIHLLTHIVEQHSKSKSILVQAKTSANTIEYRLTNRRVAVTMAKRVQSAFKHNHPAVSITEPKDRTFCTVTVTFNS